MFPHTSQQLFYSSYIQGLNKALEMLKSSNTDFRTRNLRKKENEDPEIQELKKDEQALKDAIK